MTHKSNITTPFVSILHGLIFISGYLLILFAVLIVFTLTAIDGFGQTTSSGIIISDPYGYTHKKEHWIAKRESKKRHNLGDMVADLWRQDMTELSMFPALVDQMKQEVWAEFGACYNVSGLNASLITITIEAEPFPVSGYVGVFSGVANYNGDLHVVFWNVSDTAGVQRAAALAKGELRNYVNWHLTGQAREMWGVSVCQ